MQPKRYVSISLLALSIALIGCGWLNALLPSPMPPSPSATPITPTSTRPTCDSHPAIRLTSSATSIKVGETLTLTAVAIDIGMPLYMLSLTSGASVMYSGGNPEIKDDNIFEIVSVDGTQFVLRGKAAGQADATVSATGEIGCYNTGYSWGAAASDPLHIEVTP